MPAFHLRPPASSPARHPRGGVEKEDAKMVRGGRRVSRVAGEISGERQRIDARSHALEAHAIVIVATRGIDLRIATDEWQAIRLGSIRHQYGAMLR